MSKRPETQAFYAGQKLDSVTGAVMQSAAGATMVGFESPPHPFMKHIDLSRA